MTTLPLRARRHQQAIKDVARLTEQRDELLDKLTRVAAKLKEARRSVERYERYERLPAVAPVKPVQVPAVTPPPAPAAIPAKVDSDIPDFLRRSKPDATGLAIAAEAEAKRKAKSNVRIAKLKAKQSGEMKRMPLEGKEALKAIFG